MLKTVLDAWEERNRQSAGRRPDGFWTIGAALLLSAYQTADGAPLAWQDDPDISSVQRKKRRRLAGGWQEKLGWPDLWPELRARLQGLEETTPHSSAVELEQDWREGIRRMVTSALRDVLADPTVGPVVLKVQPGLGKTTTLAQALLDWRGRPLKVLWFLRESRLHTAAEHGSPVAEILRLFPETRADVRVIEGRQPRSGRAKYIHDRGWTPDIQKLQVRLLAHAYLPWIFGVSDTVRWAASFTRDADLVVIDEDPLDVLVTTQDDSPVPLPWPVLLTLMRESGLLQDDAPPIALFPPSGKRGAPVDFFRGNRQHASRLVAGESRVQSDAEHQQWLTAWAASLKPDLTTCIWNKFQQRLTEHLLASVSTADGKRGLTASQRRTAHRILTLVTTELRRELLAVRQGNPATRRFGLIWTPAPDEESLGEQVHLRFSLPRTLRFERPGQETEARPPVPVLILDAYAHERRYAQILSASTRTTLPGSRFQLDVETYTSAGQVNPLSLRRGAGYRHLVRLIVEAVLSGLNAQGTLDRSLLLLAPGTVTGTLKGDTGAHGHASSARALSQAVQSILDWLTKLFSPATGEDLRIEVKHWFAGRGVNRYTGWDVVALTRPRTPRAAQDRLMAHFTDATRSGEEERHQLWRYDEDVELLQLLSRGRQVRCREDTGTVPRVVTMFPLDGEDSVHSALQSSVQIRPQRDVPKGTRRAFEHRRLAGLHLAPGKLELTKLIATAVVMELLHRPSAVGLPGGWFPEEVLVTLGLMGSGQAEPSTVAETFFRVLRPEDSASAFRFTVSALEHSAASTGPWSPLTGGTAPWLPPGTARYFRQEVLALLSDHLKVSPQRVQVKGLGWIWTLEKSIAPAVYAWFRSAQSQDSQLPEYVEGEGMT